MLELISADAYIARQLTLDELAVEVDASVAIGDVGTAILSTPLELFPFGQGILGA